MEQYKQMVFLVEKLREQYADLSLAIDIAAKYDKSIDRERCYYDLDEMCRNRISANPFYKELPSREFRGRVNKDMQYVQGNLSGKQAERHLRNYKDWIFNKQWIKNK